MKFKKTFKYKLFNRILIFGFITWIQKLKGLTSKVPDRENYHYVLLDYDDIEYYVLKDELEKLMIKYNIGGFVLFSDKMKSYRVFSDTVVNIKTLYKIMLDADGVDRMFFKWSVIRGYATIRIEGKKGRVKDKIVAVVGKPNMEIVKEKLKFIEYETDMDGEEKI